MRIRRDADAARLRGYILDADALIEQARGGSPVTITLRPLLSLRHETMYARLRQWQHRENLGRSNVELRINDQTPFSARSVWLIEIWHRGTPPRAWVLHRDLIPTSRYRDHIKRGIR